MRMVLSLLAVDRCWKELKEKGKKGRKGKKEKKEKKKSENGVGGSIFYMERNNSVDEQGIMVLFGLGVIEGAG